MLAGRLVQVAKDILTEYSKLGVVDKLGQASTLSTQRAQFNYHQYNEKADFLRTWATEVINQTKIQNYPPDLQKLLKSSAYASALPAYIARVILNGFPDDKDIAISSSELGIYTKLANSLVSELSTLDRVAQKFNIKSIIIPENEISLDIVIPRDIFGNRADDFVNILSRFINIISYFAEVTTGSKKSPTLTYTSTTDPVTGLAFSAATVWAFLNFYKLALEVAEKQISLLKTVKEFRRSPLIVSSDLEDQIKTIMDSNLRQVVEKALSSVPSKIPEERINEIKVALNKDGAFVIESIANGARVGITIESIDKTSFISDAIPGLTAEMIYNELQTKMELEHKVQQSLMSLGEPTQALLTMEKSTTDKK